MKTDDSKPAYLGSRLDVRLGLNESHMMRAHELGGILSNIDKLQAEIAKGLGAQVDTCVREIDFRDRQEVRIGLDVMARTLLDYLPRCPHCMKSLGKKGAAQISKMLGTVDETTAKCPKCGKVFGVRYAFTSCRLEEAGEPDSNTK